MNSKSDDERLLEAEREIAGIREQLAEAERKARLLKEELDGFVYAASHDLKAPLRSISSYSQLLIRSCGGEGEKAEYARFILDGVQAATTLIEQLLNLSRAGSSEHRSMVNLGGIVQSVVYKLQPLIRTSGAEIVCSEMPEVSVNGADLERVFEYLIDNALKYRSEDPPRIEISAEEAGDALLVSVRDNGVGIEPKYHDLVFGAFKRLHGSEIPGSGLGLAVCRKVVEAHGGEIRVESAGRGGSAVRFSLPL